MAWAKNDYELANALLNNRSEYGLPEVLKALQLLDSGRQVRVLEKKLRRLQLSGTKVNPIKLGKIKSDIDNTTALIPPVRKVTVGGDRQFAKLFSPFFIDQLLAWLIRWSFFIQHYSLLLSFSCLQLQMSDYSMTIDTVYSDYRHSI